MKTLYDLLGIDPSATLAQIEQGYRLRLDHYIASQSRGKADEETRRIQMAREAYLLLCSPKRRQAYDQQLRLYQKARSQMASRGMRRIAAWLTVAVIALVAGLYMQSTWKNRVSAQAQEMQEAQVTRSGYTLADQQGGRPAWKSAAEAASGK